MKHRKQKLTLAETYEELYEEWMDTFHGSTNDERQSLREAALHVYLGRTERSRIK